MPQRALQPTNKSFMDSLESNWKRMLLGDEQSQLAASIKDRRLQEEIKKGGMRPFDMEEVGGMSPVMGVAFKAGQPGAIRMLKERGAKQLEKILDEGLEKRSFGIRPSQPMKAPVSEWKPYPNDELAPDTLQSLSIAQQRWPRLFGHLNDVAGVDALIRLKNLPGRVRGSISPALNKETHKLGKLGLDAEIATPETVGHELLHMKDRILKPDFDELYDAQTKVTGYTNNPFEVRARSMGRRMREITDEINNRGGKARDAKGRNIRVRALRSPADYAMDPPEPTAMERILMQDF